MQQDVNIAIIVPLPSEVMVGWVDDFDLLEVKVSDEVFEEGNSPCILFIHISITSYIDYRVVINYNYFL